MPCSSADSERRRAAPPALLGLTQPHDEAVEQGSDEWLQAALYACVTGLSHSCTEGSTVEVLAAWIDADDCLCVVYQYPLFDGVLGLRRDTDTDMYGEQPVDPVPFGNDIADFDIGEPLGTVAEGLRQDAHGVHWWGSLEADLPVLPESERLLKVISQAREEHESRRAEKAAMPRHGHLARRAEGSDEWMVIAKPFGETWHLSDAEAAASDEEIKQRLNLASLTRGDHWTFVLGPPPADA